MRILFVCHGNICRSAMAEFILKALVKAKGLEGKIHLMMSYTGVGRDVADPWYTGDFESTFQDLLEGCEAMLESVG